MHTYIFIYPERAETGFKYEFGLHTLYAERTASDEFSRRQHGADCCGRFDASTPPFAFGTSGLYISYAWWRTLIRMTHVYRTKRILYYGALPRSYRPQRPSAKRALALVCR